uniref:Amidohydrolase family protein n=1 Tax=Trepomonas sp. PC1 TaxID=1076344 RepID=A0A146KBK0_9EUKA|eukprot:JAP94200.1 Amidohydrolase family protein [Trepomonas sp. PC1]
MVIAVGSQDRHFDSRILDTVQQAIDRLDKNKQLLKDQFNVQVIPGPDQCFSNSPEMLKRQQQWALENNTIIHIHSSEEPATTEWFIKKYKMTPIEYLQSVGFLNRHTLIAHAVNLTQNDVRLISESKTKIAHNPLANTVLSSGMPPIRDFIAQNVDFAIATDGSGSADSQNILQAVKFTEQYFRALDKKPLFKAEEMIEKITCQAAEILGLNCGRLQENYQADYVLIDLHKTNMRPTNLENCVENVIWASAGNEIRYVVSNGVELVQDYKYVNLKFDPEENLQQIRELTADYLEFKAKFKVEISQTGARSDQ